MHHPKRSHKQRRPNARKRDSVQPTTRALAPGITAGAPAPLPDEHQQIQESRNYQERVVFHHENTALASRSYHHDHNFGLGGAQASSMIEPFDNPVWAPPENAPNELSFLASMQPMSGMNVVGEPPWSTMNLRVRQPNGQQSLYPQDSSHNHHSSPMGPNIHGRGPLVTQQAHPSQAHYDDQLYRPDLFGYRGSGGTASNASSFSYDHRSSGADNAVFSDSPPSSSHQKSGQDVPLSQQTTQQYTVTDLAGSSGHADSTNDAGTSDPQTNPADAVTCGYENCVVEFRGEYRKGNRARHMKSSHGVLTECEYPNCTKTFNRSDARLKHYRKEHPSLATEPQRRKPVVDHSVVEHMTSWSDPITNEGRAQYLE